jgi:hypothetical protein
VLGAQRPRICHVPEFVSSAGEEAIELAALAGLVLDEWQQFVLVNALGERADGKWAAQTVGLTVGRQNGKGSVLEARELCGLFLLGERLINHTAHQQKTATNHFKRLLTLIESIPEFDKRVLRAPKGKGNEAIELRGGQEIFFATRAGGGGRGLTADLQVYDEAMYLTEQDRASLAPTMAARSMAGNIQTWYVGSAVDQEDPAQDGVPFSQVRESGIAKGRGVAYFEWSAPGDDPASVPAAISVEPAMWALANPGLGIRISSEWVEHERTVEMGPRAFAVERLGVGSWPDPSGNADQVVSDEAWDALLDSESKRSGPVCFAFDMTPDRRYVSIGVAGKRADGLGHVEIVEHRTGAGWLVERAAELVERHDARLYCGARSPAASLIPDLADRGVKVETVDAGEQAEAFGLFVDGVTGGLFRHRGQPDLRAAVKGASTKTAGEAFAWSRKSSSVDISPLVACTLAYWAACTKMSSGEAMFAWL